MTSPSSNLEELKLTGLSKFKNNEENTKIEKSPVFEQLVKDSTKTIENIMVRILLFLIFLLLDIKLLSRLC